MAPEERWVGVEDVAAHLQVAKESIYRWIDSKGFPAHRAGRLLRFKLSEVDNWVTTRDKDPTPSGAPGEAKETNRPDSRKGSQKREGL